MEAAWEKGRTDAVVRSRLGRWSGTPKSPEPQGIRLAEEDGKAVTKIDRDCWMLAEGLTRVTNQSQFYYIGTGREPRVDWVIDWVLEDEL